MASESTDGGSLSLSLPADLEEWLEQRARRLDVDRETALVQLLASYRAAAELDGDIDGIGQVRLADEDTLEATVSEATSAVRRQLEERIDTLEAEYRENLEDVRSRVVQVKKEADRKAPRDHGHDEFDRIDALADRLAAIEEAIERSGLGDTGTEAEAESDPGGEDVDERLDRIEERLRTVAWAVSDLRDARESGETVEHIKSTAAAADIDRAKCENCASGVDIALLTDPECPHCQATVTDVEPASGFFSKPRLVVASQLESGENQ